MAALEQAQPDTDIAADAARRTLADCDRKLARHRAVLEAGANPKLVAAWSLEVQAERDAAQAKQEHLTRQPAGHHWLNHDEILALVEALGGVLAVLRDADPCGQGRGIPPARPAPYLQP